MIKNEEIKQIATKFHENKMSHAFLIETNNEELCYADVLELIKEIDCPNVFHEPCEECNLCLLIRLANLPSLITIEPDGMMIKKSQISELEERFMGKPVYSKYNIYVIRKADRLNSSAANSMLKFIEEPEENIFGVFITDNKENVIPTIRSRCQLIYARYMNEDGDQLSTGYPQLLSLLEEYITDYEQNGEFTMLHHKSTILENLVDRSSLETFFQMMLDIYETALVKRLHLNVIRKDYQVTSFLVKNAPEVLKNKLFVIKKTLKKVPFNVNMELLLDSFVLEMRDCNA